AELDGGHLRPRSNRIPADVRVLDSNGAAGLEVDLPRGGRYVLRAKVSANQAGDQLARMELRCESNVLGSFEVVSKDITAPETHEAEFEIPEAGSWWVSAAFVNDFYEPAADGAKAQDRNLVVHTLAIVGPLDPPPPTALQMKL